MSTLQNYMYGNYVYVLLAIRKTFWQNTMESYKTRNRTEQNRTEQNRTERNGTERNGTEPEVIDAQYGRGRRTRSKKLALIGTREVRQIHLHCEKLGVSLRDVTDLGESETICWLDWKDVSKCFSRIGC